MLREVFYLWDRDDLNMVARQELLDLLVTYYNTAPAHVRDNLSNPENCELFQYLCVLCWCVCVCVCAVLVCVCVCDHF